MRGTGTTTQQIESAPPKSLFVWHASKRYLDYPKSLVKRLGRPDIMVVGVEVFSEDEFWKTMRGREFPAIIVDHFTADTYENHQGFVRLMNYCCRNKRDVYPSQYVTKDTFAAVFK